MKKIIMGMLAVSILAACSSENDEVIPVIPNSVDGTISFGASIGEVNLTRVITESATGFSDGDKIGVIGYIGEAAPTEYGTEEMDLPFMVESLEYDDDAGSKFVLDKNSSSLYREVDEDGLLPAIDKYDEDKHWPKKYHWTENSKYHFYAYYPVANGDITAGTGTGYRTENIVSLPAPQSSGLRDEVLWTSSIVTCAVDPSTMIPTSSGAEFNFERKLSKLRFRVQFSTTQPPAEKGKYALKGIRFDATNQTGNLNLLTGKLQTSATGGDNITTYYRNGSGELLKDFISGPDKNKNYYNALEFAPLLYAGNNVELSNLYVTINSDELLVDLTGANFKVQEGKITYVLLTLSPAAAPGVGDEIKFTNASIRGWGELDGGTGVIGR